MQILLRPTNLAYIVTTHQVNTMATGLSQNIHTTSPVSLNGSWKLSTPVSTPFGNKVYHSCTPQLIGGVSQGVQLIYSTTSSGYAQLVVCGYMLYILLTGYFTFKVLIVALYFL